MQGEGEGPSSFFSFVLDTCRAKCAWEKGWGKLGFFFLPGKGSLPIQPQHSDFESHPPLPISQGAKSHRRYWRDPCMWRQRMDICKERCATVASPNHTCKEHPTTHRVLWEADRHKRDKPQARPWAVPFVQSVPKDPKTVFKTLTRVWGDRCVVWPSSEDSLVSPDYSWPQMEEHD